LREGRRLRGEGLQYSLNSHSVDAGCRLHHLFEYERLTRFIDDGRIELDNNTVERSIRPIALNRKNALFAGSDGGAEHWATVASLIETCKLNDIDPLAYLTDVLTRIVNGHPNRDIDQLSTAERIQASVAE
jgi:hypothetical protein